MSNDDIASKLKEYFSYGPFKATVNIIDDKVIIELPVDNPELDIKHYEQIVQLCDLGQFDKAKSRLDEILAKSPGVSDYWRIKGQIAEMEHRYEDAINDLISALKWDPPNIQALIMMGNIYARHMNDLPTAMTFLNKAVELSPNDAYALNNVGGILLQQ